MYENIIVTNLVKTDKALLHSRLTITFDSASLIVSPILILLVCILFQVAT